MDFASNSLLNMTQEKSKFINILHKIKNLILVGKKTKLINTSTDRLVLTSSPRIIYENINFSHPVLTILQEYIDKTQKMGKGDSYFINVTVQLIDCVSNLLDNGVKSKYISDDFADISTLLGSESENIINSGMSNLGISNLTTDLKEYIHRYIDEETVSKLVVEAISLTGSFDSERIRIFKIQSGSFEDSRLQNGMVLDSQPLGSVKCLKNTSIGLFNCPLDVTRTELKGNLLMKTSDELLSFTKDETSLIKKTIDSLNINSMVVLGNVNELFLEFLNLRNILVLKIFNKFDLKRLSSSFGPINDSLGPVDRKGFISEIKIVKDGGKTFTVLSTDDSNIVTLILKNSLMEVLNEMERLIESLLDNLNKKERKIASFDYIEDIILLISKSNVSLLVKNAVSDALKLVEDVNMLEFDKSRVFRYSFEFISKILEIDDYLIAKADKLDIKPRDNLNWDQD